jgi:hypothetical protein
MQRLDARFFRPLQHMANRNPDDKHHSHPSLLLANVVARFADLLEEVALLLVRIIYVVVIEQTSKQVDGTDEAIN